MLRLLDSHADFTYNPDTGTFREKTTIPPAVLKIAASDEFRPLVVARKRAAAIMPNGPEVSGNLAPEPDRTYP